MTCIVGTVHNGRVHIGGDSAGTAGWSLSVRADTKVFRNGPYVMGFTTSFRMGQILQYAFEPPRPHRDEDLMAFMVTQFVDALRATLQEAGYASKRDETESGGEFLVGINGRLFHIFDDYQVGENVDGYDACGSGQDIALGALYATPHMQPSKRIRTALAAAERCNAAVRAPFTLAASRRANA